ncbi:MAG TPA: DUF177 domain-containing protein [Thermoanaerobaculia bacterium]
MDLNLEAAFDEPIDLSHQFDFPAAGLARPELVALSHVSFTGRLERQEPGFVLNGRVVFDGVTACARCLAPVPFRRSSEAYWLFAPAHAKPREEKQERDPEDGLELLAADLDVLYYDDLVVPFDALVEEQVQLELPLKALCRDDCRGLCPMCGADRNLAPCACKPPADDRWRTLRTLLDPGN